MNSIPKWKRVFLYSLSGIFVVFSLFIFNSCELEDVEVSFSRVYIRNLLSTNTTTQNTNTDTDIYRIINVEKMPYNADTMSDTVKQMDDTTTKNIGLSNFINKTDIFPWKNISSLAIEYQQSYSIYLDNCKQPTIIRIDSGYTNTNPPLPLNEYDKKYYYALLDPPRCGVDYYIEITE